MGNSTSQWDIILSAPKPSIVLDPAVTRFDNLNAVDIEKVWRCFSSSATSMATTRKEMREFLSPLTTQVSGTSELTPDAKKEFELHANALFDHWVSLVNAEAKASMGPEGSINYIDFMELFYALVFTSKMKVAEKIEYLFMCIDCDFDGDIEFEEVILGVKSCEAGLSRMRGDTPAPERRVYDLANEWFNLAKTIEDTDHITEGTFSVFCSDPKYPLLKVITLYAEAEGSVDVDSDIDKEGGGNDDTHDDGEETFAARNCGDQFMAVKPWIGAIVPPTSYPKSLPHAPPPSTLSLEYIHGYRAHDSRNNIVYLAGSSKAIYFAAAVTVKLDIDSNGQTFHMEHTDDILSLAVSKVVEGKQLVATGEIGRTPTINVFDADTMQTVVSMKGFHKRGVSHLAFSTDNSVLFSIGIDDDHSIAVYSIKDSPGKLLYSSKGNKQKVLHLVPNPFDPKVFAQCGVKHIEFYTLSDKNNAVKKSKCTFGKGGITNALCVAYESNSAVLAGTPKGEIYVFDSGKFKRKINAHEHTINCIQIHPTGKIVTGGKDGKVIIWEAGLKAKITTLDMKSFVGSEKVHSHIVRSVSPSEDLSKLVIGTQSSSIYEVKVGEEGAESTSTLLSSGHSKGELWGLAVHPSKKEYCTVGDDAILRVWDVETKKLRSSAPAVLNLKSKARAVSYSPDGTKIAVGIGAPSGRRDKKDKNEGSFRIFNEADLTLLHETRDSKQFISEIRFSPDGKTLAVGSHDNSVYLYNVLQHFKRKAKFNKHNSYITHLDFTSDSKFLQSTCGAYELLYSETNKGQQIGSASSLRDAEWDTWTSTLGWPVQGIWPPEADGTDINMVCRSSSGKTLVTVDDFGICKLFSYPCVNPKSTSVEYRGHSSHVTNCRFSVDDKHLVTTGGRDNCVFQWRHEADEEDDAEEAVAGDEEGDGEENQSEEPEEEEGGEEESGQPEIEFEQRSGGDEFMAVKPWLGAIVAPTGPPEDTKATLTKELNDHVRRLSIAHNSIDEGDVGMALHEELGEAMKDVRSSINRVCRGKSSAAPESNRLELDWVHGYSCSGDARGTVRYSSNSSIVYFAACLNIILGVNEEGGKNMEQKFVRGHDDDVTTLTIHPNKKIFATGQVGKEPKIKVWDSENGKVLQTISGFHKRGISRLAFSDDGTTLISIGNDNDHSIALYDWSNNKLKASSKGDKAKVLDVIFAPGSTTEFVTCGIKHVKFWSVQGLNVSGKKGIMGKLGKLQAYPCCAFINSSLVVGTADGNLYKFVDRVLKKVVKAHQKAINTFYVTQDNQLLSAGRDGKVQFWDTSMNNIKTIDVAAILGSTSQRPVIKSVCLDDHLSKLLIGTEGSEIFEVDVESCKDLHNGPLISGHYKDELWGVAQNPVKREVATVGDDGTLRVWDLTSRALRAGENILALVGMARAACYSPDGKMIAVGFGGSVGKGRQKCDGEFAVFDSATLSLIHKAKDSKEWIQDLKFSPDGKTLAVGSHDNTVYFYAVDKAWKLRSKFSKHSSFITHLDFSEDSTFLKSNCGAYELLFSDVFTGNQIRSASSLRDTPWASDSCILGWGQQGIWIPDMDGTDVNACVRSKSGSVMVTTADDGKVRLYQYPCVNKKAGFEEYAGHSSHVSNAEWSLYDEFLVTVGGGDRCMFQWKHIVEEVDGGEKFAGAEEDGEGALKEVEVVEEEGEGEGDLFFEARGGGDEFMAVKPYLGSIKAPTAPPAENPMKPEIGLEIEWVFGHNSSAVKYNEEGAVCYGVAALGVQLKRAEGGEMEQKFCTGHDDDVISFAMSPDRTLMATGQMGKNPCVKVWDSGSCLLLATLRSKEWKRGVTNVCFSTDGSKLCGVGNDDDHSLVLWEDKGGRWSKPEEVAWGKGDKGKVLWVCWEDAMDSIVCGGVKFLKFFSAEGKSLKGKKGVFGKKAKIQPLSCGSFVGGKLVTGTADGQLYIWEDRKCIRIEAVGEVGEKGVAVFCCEAWEGGIVCGDKAGTVAFFDSDVKKVRTLELGLGAIKSVDVSSDRGKVLAASAEEVAELGIEGGAKETLMCSHGSGELWGLAVSNENYNLVVTSGDDGCVRVWDIKGRRMVEKKVLSDMSRAAALGEGGILAVGLGGEAGRGKKKKTKKGKGKKEAEGGYCLLKLGEGGKVGDVIKEERMAGGWVSDVKIHKGKKLAVGSHDNKVYVYDIDEGGKTKQCGKLNKHSSYITHLDFSMDGKFLQSTCGAYELLFWNMRGCKQIAAASSLRDVEWDNWTSTLGWPVQEIWPPGADGTDVNAVSITPDKKLVVTGDDFGLVKVFNYPVVTKGAAAVEGKGHSSHVTNVRCVRDGSRVVSVGGADRSVIVWKIANR